MRPPTGGSRGGRFRGVNGPRGESRGSCSVCSVCRTLRRQWPRRDAWQRAPSTNCAPTVAPGERLSRGFEPCRPRTFFSATSAPVRDGISSFLRHCGKGSLRGEMGRRTKRSVCKQEERVPCPVLIRSRSSISHIRNRFRTESSPIQASASAERVLCRSQGDLQQSDVGVVDSSVSPFVCRLIRLQTISYA
jgi:hypothetical protein